MSVQYTARVTFANGISASAVTARMFDRDAPGSLDDDLTITPGTSDANGVFTLEYDPGRYKDGRQVTVMVPVNPPYDWTLVPRTSIQLDNSDTYQPYLSFSYTLNGQNKSATLDLKSPHANYALPEVLPQQFMPSKNGWKFVNAFSGYFLPFGLPTLPFLGNPSSVYGLCGGMSAAALDMFLANRAIPNVTAVPQNGTPIQRYLFQRQMDSFGTLGSLLVRFAEWMGLPDGGANGTQKLTADEFTKNIKPRLDNFTPTPIGLQYVKWSDSREVWLNHQVLAYRYEKTAEGKWLIYICDPNFPTREDIRIEAQPVDLGAGLSGLSCVQRIGSDQTKKLYGFCEMSYQPTIPPADI